MSRRRVLVPLRWSDVDAYGHVNNVQMLRLLEEARVQLFGSATGTADAVPGLDLVTTGLIVARTEIEYLQPLDFRSEPIPVDVWVTAIRTADFDLAYQVLDDRSGAIYCQALTTMVTYDLVAETPRRLPPVELDRLRRLAGPEPPWRRRPRTGKPAANAARQGARDENTPLRTVP